MTYSISYFKIRAACSHCGWEQRVNTLKSHKCFKCQRTFTVYPKRGKTNIVSVNEPELFKRKIKEMM